MLEGSIIQQLAIAHPAEKTPKLWGVLQKQFALCHALEDCILASNSAPLVITASNEEMVFQEAERYYSLAQNPIRW